MNRCIIWIQAGEGISIERLSNPMPVPFLPGLNSPVYRLQTLQPVVLIPIPSGPFDQQLGDLTDVGRPFELAERGVAASDAVRAGALNLAFPALLIE